MQDLNLDKAVVSSQLQAARLSLLEGIVKARHNGRGNGEGKHAGIRLG
jgi:hypothetical protein